MRIVVFQYMPRNIVELNIWGIYKAVQHQETYYSRDLTLVKACILLFIFPFYKAIKTKYNIGDLNLNNVEDSTLGNIVSFAFSHQLNLHRSILLQNKYCWYLFCIQNRIPSLNILSAKESNTDIEYFIKPLDESGGYGCFCTKHPEPFLDAEHVLVQKRHRNSKEIINISDNSNLLSTFRICTFNSRVNLDPLCYFRYSGNKNVIVDNVNLLTSWLRVDNLNETIKYSYFFSDDSYNMNCISKGVRIPGIGNFIKYVQSLHNQHFTNIVGIGWDVTQLECGTWVIVECNTRGGYYIRTPDTEELKLYQTRISETYIEKLQDLRNTAI